MAKLKQNKTQRINALLVANPELKPKEIAKRLNVSPNLVHQVKWQAKKNSEFVSKVFAKAKMRPTPERSDDPKVTAAEDKYIGAVESLYKKPTRLLESAREMKAALDALDKIKDRPDPVNHPPHYKAGGVETIDFIEAKDLNYRLGNVVKYVTRAEKKGNPIEDLKKARWYLDREISVRENA